MWIRIDTDIAQHRKTLVLRMSIGRPTPTTVGHLAMLFSRLADNESDGDIGDLPSEVIEEWAGWDGEPGAFDRAFREYFVTDGVIDGWEERQGTLMARQRKDRERKRAERAAKVGAPSAGRPQDSGRTSGGNPDATVTGTVTTTTKPSAAAASVADGVRDPETPDRRKESRRQRKPKPAATEEAAVPRENWLDVVAAVWHAKFSAASAFPWGKAGKQLAPLKERPPGEVADRLARYLDSTDARYLNLAKFAETYGAWGDEELLTDELGRPTPAYFRTFGGQPT